MSSIDNLITDLENLVNSMRYVNSSDEIRADDINLLIRYTKEAVELLKAIYDSFKTKTGKTLSDVEYYINVADMRSSYLQEVLSLDAIDPDNHTIVIDTLKLIELALQVIEKNL